MIKVEYVPGTKKEQLAKRVISTILRYSAFDTNAASYLETRRYWISERYMKTLIDEFIDRTGDSIINSDVDRAITDLSNVGWKNEPFAKVSVLKKPAIIEILAWFCQQSELLWDITDWDDKRREALKKSDWGQAMETYGLYVDANAPAQASAQTTTTQTAAQATTTQPAAQAASSNANAGTGIKKGEGKYAQSGKHSDKVTFLIGKPGQKIMLTGIRAGGKPNRMLSIITDPSAGKAKVVYIDPIDYYPPLNSVDSGSDRVKLGAPHYGWASTLYFDDPNVADQFKAKCQGKFGQSLVVTHSKCDSNGYFKVMTEFGEAYIRADRLNEELLEEKQEPEFRPFKEIYEEMLKNNSIGDVGIFSECLNRE